MLLLLLQKHILCFLKPQVSANGEDCSEISPIHTQEDSFWDLFFFIIPLPQASHHPDHKHLSESSSLLIKWSLKKILGIYFNCGLRTLHTTLSLQKKKCLEVKNEVHLNKISSLWSFMYSNLIVCQIIKTSQKGIWFILMFFKRICNLSIFSLVCINWKELQSQTTFWSAFALISWNST